MGKTTGIEWADATWNPWIGCTKVSAGCANCYMFREQKRFGHDPTKLRRSKTTFEEPLKWKDPRRIFVCSWSDFAYERVPMSWVDEAWEIMRRADWHTYMILTKRPHSLRNILPSDWDWDNGWPHVWIGVTVEDRDNMCRLVALEDFPARVRFVSAEPLLGPLPDLYSFLPTLNWCIVGGESGPNARPMKPEWVRDIRDQCLAYDIPFFFKQWGGMSKVDGAWGGRLLDGRTWDDLPMAGKEKEG